MDTNVSGVECYNCPTSFLGTTGGAIESFSNTSLFSNTGEMPMSYEIGNYFADDGMSTAFLGNGSSYGTTYGTTYGNTVNAATVRATQNAAVNVITPEAQEIGEDQALVNQYLSPYTEEGQSAQRLMYKLNESLHKDDEKRAESLLKQMNPHQLAAVELLYGQASGDPLALRTDIKKHFGPGIFHASEDEMLELMNKAADVSPLNAAIALKDATDGTGTDKDTLHEIIDGSDRLFLRETVEHYEAAFGSLTSDIDKDLHWIFGERREQQDLINKIDEAYIY